MIISFDERTQTEWNYDYVMFYKDESHTEYWGDVDSGKYMGRNGYDNWPGKGINRLKKETDANPNYLMTFGYKE